MSEKESPIHVNVTFRHTEATPALKSHAIEKITHCLEKYISDHADAQVVLSVEKRDHTAEVKITSKRYEVTAKAVTEDLYSSIDKVIDTIEAQIRKQKERLVSQKHQSVKEADVF